MHVCMHVCSYLVSLIPVRSQFRPHLVPPPAAPCPSVQSCRRSGTATELDYKSPGVREALTSEQMSSAEVVPYQTSQLLPPLWPQVFSSEASSLIDNHRGDGTPKVVIPEKNGVKLPDGSKSWRLAPLSFSGICGRYSVTMSS